MRGQSARRLLLPPSALAAIGLVIALAIVPPLIGGFFVSALTSYLIFGLLALSVGHLSLGHKPTCRDVEREARKHVVSEATLVGLYAR